MLVKSVILNLLALLGMCHAQCSPIKENQRQQCMYSRQQPMTNEFIKQNKSDNADYSSFCGMAQELHNCMQPLYKDCASIREQGIYTDAYVMWNTPPINCSVTDENGERYRHCMPKMLATCEVHVANIQQLIKDDQGTSQPEETIYQSTCHAIREYVRCFNTAKKGCSEKILQTYEKTMKPFRDHTTYDCFPGDSEPMYYCWPDSKVFSCTHRYLTDTMYQAQLDSLSGYGNYSKTCRFVQLYYDCVTIKTSGCNDTVRNRELMDVNRLAGSYKCHLDTCRKLWSTCVKQYSSQLSQDDKCPGARQLAKCAQFVLANKCTIETEREIENSLYPYKKDCSLKPVNPNFCDADALNQCRVKYGGVLSTQHNDPKICSNITAFMSCADPLIKESCGPEAVKSHNYLIQIYSGQPYHCKDITCGAARCVSKYLAKDGLVPESVNNIDRCRYVEDYARCIATYNNGSSCSEETIAAYTRKTEPYNLYTQHHCHEGKFCNVTAIDDCQTAFIKKVKEVGQQRNQKEKDAYCFYTNHYVKCVRKHLGSCPQSYISDEFPQFSNAEEILDQCLHKTPCIGTCGVGTIAAVPIIITITVCLNYFLV